MKKITFLLLLVFAAFIANAQKVVFNETCGENGTTANPRTTPAEYDDWDNQAPVTFSNTTERYPDVRKTSTIDTHVWFGANYDTDLVISNIATEGYSSLKLSFDVTSNKGGGDANANKVKVFCNDVEVTVPNVAIAEQNVYVNSGEIALPDAQTTKLRFFYTAANNPTGFGYRIDNIKITGTGGAGFENPSAEALSCFVSGRELIVRNAAEGTIVEIYNALGSKVQTASVNGAAIDMSNLANGVYIVRAGKFTQKIML